MNRRIYFVFSKIPCVAKSYYSRLPCVNIRCNKVYKLNYYSPILGKIESIYFTHFKRDLASNRTAGKVSVIPLEDTRGTFVEALVIFTGDHFDCDVYTCMYDRFGDRALLRGRV